MNRTDGTRLCCRFSMVPNRLKYCGPQESTSLFLEHIRSGEQEQRVRDRLRRFEGLYPYLSLIADKHGLDLFDKRVVEAYWLGNDLLDAFSKQEMILFLDKLKARGLPERYAADLRERMPQDALPHHTFNVMYVGVGRITGSVETTLPNMNNCMISWGRVDTATTDQLTVTGPRLDYDKEANRFFLRREATREVPYQRAILSAKPGDIVAMHWKEAIALLSEDQVKRLERYTTRVIEAVSASLPTP